MNRTILALALVLVAPLPAHAAVRTWPALFAGPCTGTLQDCINGAAPGDIVQIGADDILFPDRYTLVDENAIIGKSLTLRAAPGIDAVFASGRGVLVSTGGPTAFNVTVSDIAITRGAVNVIHGGSGASTYVVQRVRVADVDEGFCAINMTSDVGTALASFQAFDNAVRLPARATTLPRSQGICIVQAGTARQDVVSGNRIEAGRDAVNAAISVVGAAGGPITVQRNAVLGERFLSGIAIGGNTGTGRLAIQVDDNVVSGQDADAAAFGFGIAVRPDNADVVVTNNTVVRGARGISLFPASGASSVAGRVANNLVAFHDRQGLTIDQAATGVLTNRNNLVFANTVDLFVPGSGTRTQDPLLRSLTWPRLRDDSPAVNAGDNASVPSFASFDGDGETRIILGTIDIGAFEANAEKAVQETALPADTFANQSRVQLAPLVTVDRLFVTPRRTASGGAALTEQLGTYLFGGTWYAYLEDPFATLPPGYGYNLLVPVLAKRNFTHVTSVGSVFEDTSQLTDPELDSRPFAIAALSHLYQLGSGPASYHDFPIGLEYTGTRWYIRNQDSATMTSDRAFHVMVAPLGSPNAFRARSAFAASEIRLDHPLLDDNACAAFVATRLDDPDVAGRLANPAPYSVDYRAGAAGAPGRWFAVAEGGASFPAGTAFNVIVDGQQANACRAPAADDLFANGFE